MCAEAGKTFLWCEANIGPSVTLPQMFGLRGYTGIIVVQKSGHSLSCSYSLSSLSFLLLPLATLQLSFSFVFMSFQLSVWSWLSSTSTLYTDWLHVLLVSTLLFQQGTCPMDNTGRCLSVGSVFEGTFAVMVVAQDVSYHTHATLEVGSPPLLPLFVPKGNRFCVTFTDDHPNDVEKIMWTHIIII